jgi:hypothetical protein
MGLIPETFSSRLLSVYLPWCKVTSVPQDIEEKQLILFRLIRRRDDSRKTGKDSFVGVCLLKPANHQFGYQRDENEETDTYSTGATAAAGHLPAAAFYGCRG